MIQLLTIEDIKAAMHKWDLINKPYSLYYNPKDKGVVQAIMTTSTGDNLSPVETSLIKPGQVLLIDRTKVEDFQFVNYKDIEIGDQIEFFNDIRKVL